jgi:enolase-phosphatase E1
MEPTRPAALERSRAATPLAIRRSGVRTASGSVLRFTGKALIFAVEGTLCSRSYLEDVLEPYSRKHLAGFLRTYWFDGVIARFRDQIAQEAGGRNFETWCQVHPDSGEAFVKLYDEILSKLNRPALSAALTELLEAIWREGLRKDDLRSQVFPDVPAALRNWTKSGRDVRTFSTLSVPSQCALLAKTTHGNLLGYFRDHYDTKLGCKRAPGSFCTIADDLRLEPREVLFVSDESAELDAARVAGLATAWVRRGSIGAVPPGSLHLSLSDLRALAVV